MCRVRYLGCDKTFGISFDALETRASILKSVLLTEICLKEKLKKGCNMQRFYCNLLLQQRVAELKS